MSVMQWAKFPTQWIKPTASADGAQQHYPLTELQWSVHAGSAIAAVLVLIALSIRLNQSHKDMDFPKREERTTRIAVTYADLRKMTGLAKATISKALMLLEGFAAIEIQREGKAQSYRLLGLEVGGGWCMLPHGWLLKRDGTLKIKHLPRNRFTLNALKAYLALMNLRNNSLNTAAASYTAIERWTGIRRQDIAHTLGTLSSLQLATVSPDRDFRHSKGDNSHRYSIIGLGDGRALHMTDDLVTHERTAEELVYVTPVMTLVTPLKPARPEATTSGSMASPISDVPVTSHVHSGKRPPWPTQST